MDARQIKDMRALLAAQTPVAEPRAPGLGRTLSRLLAPRPAACPPVALVGAPESEPAPPAAVELAPAPVEADEAPFLLQDACGEPVPPQLLLGDIGPRRPAFGQRSEAVLELQQPAPAATRRLTLTASDGAAVGEIILHTQDIHPANDVAAARLAESQHCEAPFFPEDLADEPDPSFSAPRRAFEAPASQPKAAQTHSALAEPAAPPPELAAAFLLASLAARLASEDAALRRRLDQASVTALAA